MAIKIITDSTCDIRIKDCERMGVSLVPLRVTIDNVTYLDKFELSCEEFYEKLASAQEIPVTTLAGPQDFLSYIDNAALVCEVIQRLQNLGYPVTEAALRKGLAEAAWPGRFQLISRKPIFIVDGAHNEAGAIALKKSLEFYFTKRRHFPTI